MHPITVLVADDEAMVRTAVSDMLGAHPLIVVVGLASDAAGAVALARTHHPSVALLDVRMPGGGGVEAARGIRLASPQTHILAHSAFDDARSLTTMLAAGAEGLIVKGTDGPEILERVLAAGQAARAS
ncbi:MAG TPA: response regulator transcription factor [Candidatus Dormibacteraeota bacterium]|nr:response regulator transcription factor [Candidatus Dormibacteraeota bacterium]